MSCSDQPHAGGEVLISHLPARGKGGDGPVAGLLALLGSKPVLEDIARHPQ